MPLREHEHPTVAAIKSYGDELAEIRRLIHSQPELGFAERKTASLVARMLASWGLEVTTDVGVTGVVGTLRGSGTKKSIGLRAELDALPITEQSGVMHASRNPGVMHACGHDGHIAMLLGAARYLAEAREFDGTIHFIFQPAEESLLGAQAMIADGLLERFPLDVIFALHNRPGIELGKISVRRGAMMAGAANFEVTLSGQGGHGARPEGCVDPVYAACQLVCTLQTIVSRNVSPLVGAVVSVTKIAGGESKNTIPDAAKFAGTIRCLSSPGLLQIKDRFVELVEGISATLGTRAHIAFESECPALCNDAEAVDTAASVAEEIVGSGNVDDNCAPLLSSEDFSFMLERCRGAYLNIGVGTAAHSLHSSRYDFQDEVTPIGAAVLARLAERLAEASN